MAPIRKYLLAIIGMAASVRAAADLKKNGLSLPPDTASPNGKKGGAAAGVVSGSQLRQQKQSPTLQPAKPVSAPGGKQAHHSLAKVDGIGGYAKELFQRFSADHCPAWAASLSFFSLLSIAPVLLCGLAVLGFLIQDPHEAARRVEQIVTNLLPGSGAQKSAHDLIAQLNIEKSAESLMKTRGVAGLIGVISLFWSSMQIFLNAMTPMNAAFGTEETRGFIKIRLVALGLLLGAGILFLLSLVPSSGAHLLRSIPIGFLQHISDPSPLWLDIVLLLISIAINAVMFTVIYRFLPSPSAKVTWNSARFAGIVVAVLWEAAKQAFAFYLQRFGSAGYNKMYGTLGGLIAMIFWIYYSSMILLLGAEIAKLHQDIQEKKRGSAAV